MYTSTERSLLRYGSPRRPGRAPRGSDAVVPLGERSQELKLPDGELQSPAARECHELHRADLELSNAQSVAVQGRLHRARLFQQSADSRLPLRYPAVKTR